MEGYRRGGWGHPKVSIPWQERLALLDVTRGLFSLTASCGYTGPIFLPPRLPYVTWLHFCLLVPPNPLTPHGPHQEAQRGHCCYFLLLPESLLDKLVTLKDFVCFVLFFFFKLHGSRIHR